MSNIAHKVAAQYFNLSPPEHKCITPQTSIHKINVMRYTLIYLIQNTHNVVVEAVFKKFNITC